MQLYDVIRKDQKKKDKKSDDAPLVFVPTEPPRKRKKHILFFSLILTGIVLLYIAGVYVVRAKVIVEERTIPFALDKTVITLPHESQSDTERLSFQTMTVTTTIQREVFGSELTQVTGKAKGAVVFFNEYSKTEQLLKTGTKLLGSNGKTYLTQQSVTIPGYTLDAKKKKIAGTSPSVSIIATDTGPASNTTGVSVSISAFSGTKKQQLYGRSVGKGFGGGEQGMRHTVSDAERPALLETLKTQLSERLRRETRAQIPEQLITYPDLQFISIDSDSLKLEGEGIKFTAQIKGTIVSYLIPRGLFESAIAKEVLSDHSYTTVSIPALAALTVSPESAIPANPQTLPDSISIAVSGDGTIITKIAPEKIQESLLGAKRGSFDTILSTFPEIASAKFKLLPFWAPFFPKQDKYIQVIFKDSVDL